MYYTKDVDVKNYTLYYGRCCGNCKFLTHKKDYANGYGGFDIIPHCIKMNRKIKVTYMCEQFELNEEL
ncbi:MAG: hypothetical protein ACRC7S_19440 [Cetobacterium sp.]